MKAVTWQGVREVSVEEVPDPVLREDTDIIIEITSSGLCGSDLHLYETLGPFLHPGDVLGHEPMGRVVEKGSAVTNLELEDRVVVPFQIACGHCFMCSRDLQTQCETTQVTEHGMGAALFGYTDLYGAVPGAQAEYLRVPQAHYGPIKVADGPPDDRYLYLSDVLPTAWQSVEYAGVSEGDTLAVIGLGPIGLMAVRVAQQRGVQVVGIDLVPERLAQAGALGASVVDLRSTDPGDAVRELTAGRGADAAVDAVGMEAHGSGLAGFAQKAAGILPDALARPIMKSASVDRLAALTSAFDVVRRGGVVSVVGVYAGAVDPLPLQSIFDKQLTIRTGQANVRRWVDDMLPVVEADGDPLGLEGFATHHVPLQDAAETYASFQAKEDGMIKVVFRP